MKKKKRSKGKVCKQENQQLIIGFNATAVSEDL
jgi:hypothetical protein